MPFWKGFLPRLGPRMPVFSAGVDGRVRFLVEVHLQLSGMACGMGNRCPRALKEPDLNCHLYLLYLIIPRPWDFTSCLRSPGGPFCLCSCDFGDVSLPPTCTGLVGSCRCFHVIQPPQRASMSVVPPLTSCTSPVIY